jgi:hypothetical protein
MSKQIPPKPALLIAQLQMMTAALTKYTETYVPVSPSQADIEACTADLVSALQTQVQTAGAAEKATKDLYAVRDRAMDLLRRMRMRCMRTLVRPIPDCGVWSRYSENA